MHAKKKKKPSYMGGGKMKNAPMYKEGGVHKTRKQAGGRNLLRGRGTKMYTTDKEFHNSSGAFGNADKREATKSKSRKLAGKILEKSKKITYDNSPGSRAGSSITKSKSSGKSKTKSISSKRALSMTNRIERKIDRKNRRG